MTDGGAGNMPKGGIDYDNPNLKVGEYPPRVGGPRTPEQKEISRKVFLKDITYTLLDSKNLEVSKETAETIMEMLEYDYKVLEDIGKDPYYSSRYKKARDNLNLANGLIEENKCTDATRLLMRSDGIMENIKMEAYFSGEF